MTPLAWCLLLVVLQRLGELAVARRNTARLVAEGAVEHGRGHYGLIVALHVAWLIALAALVPWRTVPSTVGIVLFLALQLARLWVLRSLGGRWTTRVIVLPGTAPVVRGPYRWLRHPNYLIVTAELFTLPAAFGAWTLATAFTLLNAALLLLVRIPVEERALAAAARDRGTARPDPRPANPLSRKGKVARSGSFRDSA